MTFGYRSRFGRSGFRSPRGGRSTQFRGRGRGSDSYFGSSRGSYSDRSSSFRGSSYRDSNYRSRDDNYESHSSRGNRYSGDRYSSRGRKDNDSNHHRNTRESTSGSFGREYPRRSDGEPERKRPRSEIGTTFKEGASPRRSYDNLEHSSRSFNSTSSPYRSESSSFGKSHRKEFSDFKKPLPPEQSYRRSSRGRIISTGRPTTSRVTRPSAPAFLKRAAVSRLSRLRPVSRHLLLLRKKKQIRIMRMRREREDLLRMSGKDKITKDDEPHSSDDLEGEEEDVESEQNVEDGEGERSPTKSNSEKKVIKKESTASPDKSASQSESSKMKDRDKVSPVRGLYHIPLKCIHCKTECKTFKVYQHHLTTMKHKDAMEKLLYSMKQKLRRMRTEQREQQRIIDEQNDNYARTSYCKLCKLNYKQTRQEHYTSDFHISMNEFLNSRCSICRISFNTPILYEHHRCTLTHIKRKAFLERRGINVQGDEDENNEEDNFMVLDSVGSADESNEDEANEDGKAVTGSKKAVAETKKKLQKIIGGEFIKKVSVYYCRLCKLCLHYNPNRNAEEYVLSHCRTRFHLKRFSMEKPTKSSSESPSKKMKIQEKEDDSANMSDYLEMDNDQFWDDVQSGGENHKLSEDEDDSQSSNRYDRFGTSEENDNVDKQKAENENADHQNSKNSNQVQDSKVETK